MEMFNKIIDRRKFLKLMLAAGSVICGTNAYGFLKLENKDKLKLVLGNNSDSIFIGDIEAVTNEVYVHFYNPKDVVKVTNETIEVNLEILCSKLLPVNEIVLYLDNEYLMGKRFSIIEVSKFSKANFKFTFNTEINKKKFRDIEIQV